VTTVGDAADDDPTIADAERLLRRVHRKSIVLDRNQNRWRPSSAAFDDDDDGISVFLSSVITEQLGRPEGDALIDHPEHSLVAFTAGQVRSDLLSPPLGVKRDPEPLSAIPHPCSAAHALMVGLVRGKPGDKQQRKPLAAKIAREWVVANPPANVSLEEDPERGAATP
jgi:hypothetical protein